MSQRGRKANPRTTESSGGNTLFTLGLVSVVALLIVGWVMQGGMESISQSGSEALNTISLAAQSAANQGAQQNTQASQPQQNTSLQQTAPQTSQAPAVANGPGAINRTQLDAELRRLEDQYKTKIEQERDEFQRRLQSQKTNYESQIKDLEMKMKILQIENQSLRGGQ